MPLHLVPKNLYQHKPDVSSDDMAITQARNAVYKKASVIFEDTLKTLGENIDNPIHINEELNKQISGLESELKKLCDAFEAAGQEAPSRAYYCVKDPYSPANIQDIFTME